MKFFEIDDYMNDLRGKNIIIGGRGIGKTYSSLRNALNSLRPGRKFIYLRNTDIQLDECCSDFGNPFKKLNTDYNDNVRMTKSKQHANIIDKDDNIIGYGCALSTFGNLRSVDLSDVDLVIFEEFIEARTLTFDQFKAFQHFYETVNRNRELFGEPALVVIMLSNSQSLNNPILIGYNLVEVIEKMIISGQEKYKKGDIFVLLPDSEISRLKAQTAHYKDLKGTKIYKEIIENQFSNDSMYAVVKRPLVEYIPVCKLDDVYIYRHKSNSKFYICHTAAINIPEYTSKDNKMAFYKAIGRVLTAEYPHGNVEFSSFLVKSQILKIII